ncbi:MAG: orotate phosphoribosyltransferase [archaeon]
MNYGKEIAKISLSIGSIKLRPGDPFTWASGYRMPIYNDNRMLLFYSEYRALVAKGFKEIIDNEKIECDVIAGTSTAGIPHATILADLLNKPMIYIRDKPKDHGLKNQIEGLDADKDLEGKKVIVIEDLISTGGSSAKAVQAVRDAKGKVEYCLSIFSYGLDKAKTEFDVLPEKTEVRSILTYDVLLETAKEINYLTSDQIELLADWRKDPFNWGAKNGFPKIEK